MRCTVEDLEFVESILFHPEIYCSASDDGTDLELARKGVLSVLSEPSVYVLSPNKFTVLLFVPQNSVTYELHTNVLPEGRGRIAFKALREAGDWMINNTPCLKVVTNVPENNRPAAILARLAGFKLEGTNRKSFLSGDNLYDQHIFGITKEEWVCQQSL